MKIVKAQKKIARLKGEIKEIKKRISACISTIKGNEFPEDFKILDALLMEKTSEMIQLKEAVMKANIAGNMFGKILALGEQKSMIDFLKELDPKKGIQESWHHDSQTEYDSQLTTAAKNALVEACQKKINDMTDDLDEYNATTSITL
jgi:hypothetical protein